MKDDDRTRSGDTPFFVGIGSSAGGLEAITSLVQNLPLDANVVYVLAQHMSPNQKSLLSSLISRETELPVVELGGDTDPVPNTIYVTPPKSDVVLRDRRLVLMAPSGHAAAPKPSADRLFSSLASECREHCVGIVLSGTGSDGSYGVQAIREAGGVTIAQDSSTAQYDGMPTSAIETGCIDLTLSPGQIGQHLEKILASPRNLDELRHINDHPNRLSELQQILLARTKVDFRDYKESTVARRIYRRMAALNIGNYEAYVDHCRTSADEVDALFRDLLISVTRFFRDPNQFEKLLPQIQRLVRENEFGQLRIWVGGCATGEEVYSLAILLAEALGGPERLQKSRVQIFASDIDERALEIARRGSYPISAANDVPVHYLEKYFKVHEDRLEVIQGLRSVSLFSPHNIFQDPPFLNVDLISLRNVLIYFNTSLQNRVLQRLHHALKHDGVLFLGTSENVGSMESLFEPMGNGEKAFKKRRVSSALSQTLNHPMSLRGGWRGTARQIGRGSERPSRETPDTAFESLARMVAPNGFVSTRSGEIVRVFGQISSLIELSENAPLLMGVRNLRKPLRDEAIGLIAAALRKKAMRRGRWHRFEDETFNEARMVCYPLLSDEDGEDHALVALETRKNEKPQVKLDALTDSERRDYVLDLENELQTSRTALQQIVEELQTSNEELQSINEEMQSGNEELQATNEELETSNEELQSTNEELITVNEELQINSAELQRVTTELLATLDAVPYPVLVIDPALIVRRLSRSAKKMLDVDDLPLAGLHLSQCSLPRSLSELSGFCSDAFRLREHRTTTRQSGGSVWQVSVTPFFSNSGDVLGVVVMLVDNVAKAETIELLQRFGDIGHWHVDLGTNELFWSDEMFRIHGLEPQVDAPSFEHSVQFFHPDDQDHVREMFQRCRDHGDPIKSLLRLVRADGNTVIVESVGKLILDAEGSASRVSGIFRKVSEGAQRDMLFGQIENIHASGDLEFYSHDLVSNLLHWSSGLLRLFEIEAEDDKPSVESIIQKFHPCDRERLSELLRRTEGDGTPETFDVRLESSDGSVIKCRVSGQIEFDETNTPAQMRVSFQILDAETVAGD